RARAKRPGVRRVAAPLSMTSHPVAAAECQCAGARPRWIEDLTRCRYGARVRARAKRPGVRRVAAPLSMTSHPVAAAECQCAGARPRWIEDLTRCRYGARVRARAKRPQAGDHIPTAGKVWCRTFATTGFFGFRSDGRGFGIESA